VTAENWERLAAELDVPEEGKQGAPPARERPQTYSPDW
jgi:hypothetical protein